MFTLSNSPPELVISHRLLRLIANTSSETGSHQNARMEFAPETDSKMTLRLRSGNSIDLQEIDILAPRFFPRNPFVDLTKPEDGVASLFEVGDENRFKVCSNSFLDSILIFGGSLHCYIENYLPPFPSIIVKYQK